MVGVPDAAHVNAKLRGILNSYQDALDKINTLSYTCTQLVEYLSSVKQGAISYSVASADYMQNLIKEGEGPLPPYIKGRVITSLSLSNMI